MKKLSIICGVIAMALAVGCTKDVEGPVVPTTNGEIYARVSLSLPSTRAIDEEGYQGEEYGQDCENTISSLTLVIMKEESGSYTYITSASVTSTSTTNSLTNLGNTARPTYSAVFKDSALKTYISTPSNPRNVKLFVICNPRSSFNEYVSSFNPVSTTFETKAYGSFNTANRFIMTSEPFSITLPDTVSELVSYDSAANPWDITRGAAIPVERAIARFDYRVVNNNIYDITEKVITENEGETTKIVGQIELTDMALINDRSAAYYIARTSAKGYSNEPMTLQHVAKATSTYVVTPNSTNLSDRRYRYPFTETVNTATAENTEDLTEGYIWTSMNSLSQDDIDEGWTANPQTGYKIWRYVNENTIPDNTSSEAENTQQLQKYTTGVVFRGKILNYNNGIEGYGEDKIYAFHNTIYGGLKNLALSAMASTALGYVNPDLHYAFAQTWDATPVYDPEDTEHTTPIDYTCTLKDGQTPAGNKITVYKNEGSEEEPVYNVYYYYWNRHNDNYQGNVMGPMEFAVVRNNVYKLSVTGINKFGHTTKPEFDPDPTDPDDPDEEEQVYIKVNVAVLPWTVRVNNIEF